MQKVAALAPGTKEAIEYHIFILATGDGLSLFMLTVAFGAMAVVYFVACADAKMGKAARTSNNKNIFFMIVVFLVVCGFVLPTPYIHNNNDEITLLLCGVGYSVSVVPGGGEECLFVFHNL